MRVLVISGGSNEILSNDARTKGFKQMKIVSIGFASIHLVEILINIHPVATLHSADCDGTSSISQRLTR